MSPSSTTTHMLTPPMTSISPITTLFFLFSFFFFFSPSNSYSTTIYEPNNLPKEKMTHLHFFFHDPNASAAQVVKPVNNDSSFGNIGIIDDFLREGPDVDSKIIGRCQGLTFVASKVEVEFSTLLTLAFDVGEFAGSSLQVYGKALLGTVIERPIVGGTGEFRMARGYTISKMVLTPVPDMLILEYDVYAWHY